MENFNKQKWEDLNLSRDEVTSIGQALKKEEFRNLLTEYVKEINDPNNRKQYEEEITQLENERGVDIKFIHPNSGYVIKTSVDGKKKAFINICTNNNVGVPFSSTDVEGGHQGLRWSIPYCMAPPRDDLDKKKKLCIVYDVVFHPDTLALSKNNVQFKKLVNDTALGAIEENFKVSLDKVNLKFPKMQFKGLKHATVIRKKIESFQSSTDYEIPNYPYQPIKEDVKIDSVPKEVNSKKSSQVQIDKDLNFTTPRFTIKHRSTIEMENFTNDPMCKMTATVPDELIVIIDLPLLKSSSDASVDVTENSFTLVSEKPAKYKLELKLPYSVHKNKGSAKFDMSKKELTVTLSVIKERRNRMINKDLSRDDSGVESDNGNGRSDSTSSNEEEEADKISEGYISNQTECQSKEVNDNRIDKSFLEPNLHYSLPDYLCNYLEDGLVFTFQVPNVNPDSVKYRILNGSSGFHITFTSVGAGFFSVNNAVYFMLSNPRKIENNTFTFDVWDNNVTAQVKLQTIPAVTLNLNEYYIGTDENNLQKGVLTKIGHESEKVETLETTENINKNANCKKDYEQNKTRNESVEVEAETNETIHNEDQKTSATSQEEDQTSAKIKSKENKCPDEVYKENLQVSENSSNSSEKSVSPQRQSAKSRTVSESQQEDGQRNKNRGILKIGRSLSESSVDDYASWSAEKSEKTKKTVRFSDVISKQVFRMNSSILGQRKKNQRKTKNKKRAQERRLSESGNESEGDNEFPEVKGKQKELKEDTWLNEPESSSCDVSEVSDVSDISESDDGQKENGPPSLPCSSRKNHKRRGKKSARKNAATAKLNYMEY